MSSFTNISTFYDGNYFGLQDYFRVRNQGDRNSCFSCAMSGAMEFILANQIKSISGNSIDLDEESLDNIINRGSGVNWGWGLKFTRMKGIKSTTSNKVYYIPKRKKKFSPYKPFPQKNKKYYYLVNTKFSSAVNRLFTETTPDSIVPLVVNMKLPKDHQNSLKNNVLTYNANHEYAHTIIIIGYNSDRKSFLIKDSFGNECGIEGKWWLPEDILARYVFNIVFFTGVKE